MPMLIPLAARALPQVMKLGGGPMGQLAGALNPLQMLGGQGGQSGGLPQIGGMNIEAMLKQAMSRLPMMG